MRLNPALMLDFYKISHRKQYPENTTLVYSTWTPRASRIEGIDKVVNFGIQAFLMKLQSVFADNFFGRPKDEVIAEYARLIKYTLGDQHPDTTHLEELHDLGYLPLLIKALPEGALVPIRIPTMTIQNTDPRFFWLTNYIETLASCELWQASTSATIALSYKKLLEKYALLTVGNTDFVKFQGHDFSMRGMSSIESAISSGMGHLLSFVGTDTVPAIQALEHYYKADIEKELVCTSIPATEHSVQCAYHGDDRAYIENIITKVHPSGMVSVVSDGYDFWNVLRNILPDLKDKIMSRDGKVVIRPDSGDPVLIICGDPAGATEIERKGAVEALCDIFGGSTSLQGCKVLDPHIGLIYGDAITLKRAEEICRRLRMKGFASTNVVFGIGSYTYQYNTRDTFGYALKSTLCIIDGQEKMIWKDPITDDGVKKSQKGRVVVGWDIDGFTMEDGLSLRDEVNDNLRAVFKDGKLLHQYNFQSVRETLERTSIDDCEHKTYKLGMAETKYNGKSFVSEAFICQECAAVRWDSERNNQYQQWKMSQ